MIELKNVTTVSYTHLDVYKRQSQTFVHTGARRLLRKQPADMSWRAKQKKQADSFI